MNSPQNSIQKEILNYLDFDDFKTLSPKFPNWKDYVLSLDLSCKTIDNLYDFKNIVHLNIHFHCDIKKFINHPSLKTISYNDRIFDITKQKEKDEFVSLYQKLNLC